LKRLLLAAAAVAALAVAVTPLAQAGVAHYQFLTGTLDVHVGSAYGGYDHSYTITMSPCDGSFVGTGQDTGKISGTIAGNVINFTGVYTSGATPYNYSATGAYDPNTGAFTGTGTDSRNTSLTVDGQWNHLSQSTWKSHGDYVSAQGKGYHETATTSCIGMTAQSR
jgi:hypothetical protein